MTTQASSVWGSMPPARGPRGRQFRQIAEDARQQTQARRERVLAHEWARKRLCEIFRYKRAEQWNGYMPPKTDPLPDRGLQVARPNTASERVALLRLLRDVEKFEQTGELPAAAGEAEQLAIT